MNRQQFNSRNNIGQVLTFQKSGATNSFDPQVTFQAGSRRVSWKLNNGIFTEQIAGNAITYTGFTSDNNIREIQIRGNSFKNISNFNLNNDNLYGNLDLSSLPTFPILFIVDQNINLTGITNCQSTNLTGVYLAQSCDLIGNLDLSPLSGFGGTFSVFNNPKLTSVTLPNVSNNISTFNVNSCNIIGNLDLTPLPNLSGSFNAALNPNLTGVTHPPSSNTFSSYSLFQCGLIGNLDLTPLSGLGGSFRVTNHPLQTGITHSNTTQIFTNYQVFQNNLIGNLDLTPILNLGGVFSANNNPNLTGITHSPSNQNFSQFQVSVCNIIGTYDLSIFTNLGGSSVASPCRINFRNNSNLQNVVFPTVNTFFRNNANDSSNGAFSLNFCNLDYIDFKPLSGITLLTGATQGNPRIGIDSNGMSAGDVNHILVDFSGNTSVNPTGWSNVNLNIGGSNADPDSSSGGFDGLAAIAFLTGSPYNWTITY